MEQITKAWRESSDALTFVKALEAGGYYLARGDKRSYVVVDLYGEVHSLSRQIDGVKAKELKARLADHPPDKLLDVATVQDRARQQRQALLLKVTQQQRAREGPAAGTPATAKERREALQQAQGIRRANLESKRQQLAERHNIERKALADMHSARSAAVARDRALQHPTGVLAFLARVTGFDVLTAFRHVREDLRKTVEQHLQTAALARRHRREMQNFKQQERSLVSLDKRERRSLETSLRREGLRQIARQDRSTIRPEFAAAVAGKTEIRKDDDERREKLKRDFAAAARAQQEIQARGGEGKATKPAPATRGDLQRAFEKARDARKPSSGQQEHIEEVTPEKPEQVRKTKEELEQRKPQPPGPERDRER